MISKRTGKAEAPERVAETQSRGEKSQELPFGADVRAATFGRTKSEDHALMERVMDLSNIRLAYRRLVDAY